MGEVLKKAATTSNTCQADYLAQFAGLKTGDLHVAMEIWATTGQEAMDEAVATGKVENLGETGMQAIEEWWYPDYMKEKCPGLPNWEALKECGEAFSTPETAPKGRYLGGPGDLGRLRRGARRGARASPSRWCMPAPTRRSSPSSKSAYQRQAPIILWIYAPHWAPPSTRANGSSSRHTSRPATRIPPWGIEPRRDA